MVSIIIPAYNAEKHIEQCIDSIISQTYKNIEVIIVNDGSTDNTLAICEKYAKEDKRIKIVKKKNEGVSKARNDGIKIATGKYIMFIDSDDYIDDDYIEIMRKNIVEKKADLVISNYTRDKNGVKEKIYFDLKNDDDNITFPAVLNEYITGFYFNSIWKTIIKKNIIEDNKIQFDSTMKFGEDAVFSLKVYKNSNKTILIKNYGYHYVDNETSVTNTRTMNKRIQNAIDNFKLYDHITKYIELTKEEQILLNDRILECYVNALDTILSCKKTTTDKSYVQIIKNLNKLYIEYFESYDNKKSKLSRTYKSRISLLKEEKIYEYIIYTYALKIIRKLNRGQ